MRAGSASAPEVLDLVLLGGGHSHVGVLRRLAMKPWPGVRVTLVSREVHTPYSGMLPGYISGHYGLDDIHIDLGPLALAAGARLVAAEAMGIDTGSRQVLLQDRPPLRYDLLSVNTGSAPSLEGVTGAAEHAIPVKPISSFLPRFEAVLERLRAHPAAAPPLQLAVIGGGAGGVELVLSLHERLRRDGIGHRARLSLVTASPILVTHEPLVREQFLEALALCDIPCVEGWRVTEIRADALVADDGRVMPCDAALWVTQAGAPSWIRETGLDTDEDGFIRVGPTLQSTSHEEVFAAGDVAMLCEDPRPKSGVYAVRAAPVLADNLLRRIRGRPLRTFRPQQRALYLITTGRRYAVASRPGLPAFSGRWVWWWKHLIDTRFMRRFRDLMDPPGTAPRSVVAGAEVLPPIRCAGCGSKIASGSLQGALQRLHGDGGAGPFEDAAELRLGEETLLQTVDGFRLPVADPWLGARIATLHALGDIHAMGARALGAMVLATVPLAGGRQMEEDLFQMMAGVRHELQRAGCTLLGGHSSEGNDLALGLAVNGRPEGRVWRKQGAEVGDVLLLTRPLGTGVLLAGAMQGRVASRDLLGAVDGMLGSHGPVVEALRDEVVHACTDVTGFGLLGHLLEMLDAPDLAVELDGPKVPAYPGALQALEAGLASSLQHDNERALEQCDFDAARADAAALRLLCDPQTCGGLLLAVPAAMAEQVLAAIHSAGEGAAVRIGSFVRRGDGAAIRLRA